MTYDIQVRTLEPQPAMTVREQVPDNPGAFSEALGRIFGAVFGYVTAHGGQPVSAPLTYYHGMTGAGFDISAVTPFMLPGGEVAVTDYYGPYDGVVAAHQAIEAWLAEQGREPGEGAWEVYWTDPGEEPDPAKWRTEVFWALK
jgi:effector-binding domain-containing protein